MAFLSAHRLDYRRHNQRDKSYRRHRRPRLGPVERGARVLRRVVFPHGLSVLFHDFIRHRRRPRAVFLLQRVRRPQPPEKNLHGRHRKPHDRSHHLFPQPQTRALRAADRPGYAQPARACLRTPYSAVLRCGARLSLPHPPRPQPLCGRPQPHPPQAAQRRPETAHRHAHHRLLFGGGHVCQHCPLPHGACHVACGGRHTCVGSAQHGALALHIPTPGASYVKRLTDGRRTDIAVQAADVRARDQLHPRGACRGLGCAPRPRLRRFRA